MRKFTLAAAAVLMLGSASIAEATITIGSITPGTNPYSGPTPTYDFDTHTPPTTGGVVTTGTNGLLTAQPFGSTGNYFAVGPSAGTPGEVDLTALGNIFNISLLWGSVDSFNTLQFLGADNATVLATFTGNQVFNPATGSRTDPNTNPIVTFLLSGTDVSNFSYLKLSSSQNAFEIDNIAINAVPEPATWGMMLLGFAGIGAAMRGRRRRNIAQVA
jgi:hypothetical protein